MDFVRASKRHQQSNSNRDVGSPVLQFVAWKQTFNFELYSVKIPSSNFHIYNLKLQFVIPLANCWRLLPTFLSINFPTRIAVDHFIKPNLFLRLRSYQNAVGHINSLSAYIYGIMIISLDFVLPLHTCRNPNRSQVPSWWLLRLFMARKSIHMSELDC